MRRIFVAAVYLGIGFVCLAAFEGASINWSSAWTYGWILGWPIGLLAVIAKWFLVVLGVISLLVVAIHIWEKLR